MKTRIFVVALAIFSLSLLCPKSVQADEPTPGVARVSLIHGDVAAMRGDSGDRAATTLNAPLVSGDKISTGARSRTEIELDYANILRLDQRSEAKIADLTRTRIQVQVSQGVVNFTVLNGTEAEVEIDTPNMAVRPLGEGSYRIQVDSPSDTAVTVRQGQAEVSTPQGTTTVEKNQVIYVKGTDNPEYQIAKAGHTDEWDEWNRDRDHEIRDAQSWRYAKRSYTGAHDLDAYGHWVYVPDYDWCWTPYVNMGWVPYRDGRWVWEPYWGWTWVSYEPWGWAPYHYGRWFWWGNSWCWWPGYGYGGYYSTWAPAYVSFLGFGFGGRHWGFGFGFGFGSIGWCPLGPFDRFRPWWGHGNTYHTVNVTNMTNVTNVGNVHTRTFVRPPGATYTSNVQAALNNANVRRAITTVPVEDFVQGRVPRNPPVVNAATLRQGQVVQGTLPVVPTRDSLRPVDRAAPAGSFARQADSSQRFFTKHPAPAAPTPFAERAAEIQEMVQRHNPLQASSHGAPAGQAQPSPGRNLPGVAPEGKRTTAPESGQVKPVSPRDVRTVPEPGWQRFATGGARSVPAPSTGRPAPAEAAPHAAPASKTFQARPAPSTQSEPQGAWRQFNAPAPHEGRSESSTPRAEPASPGWSRFSSRPESAAPARREGWSAPAPRSYARPPLDIRKPIVTPRPTAPRAYEGGGGRGWSAPSGGGRSYSAPAPARGGHSAPAPSAPRGQSGPKGKR
jgi:hypothetical protein